MQWIKKYMFIFLFLLIVGGGFVGSVIIEDLNFSEIENKVLSQMPSFSVEKLISGKYMKEFDKYVVDQFPCRVELIKLKNQFMYLIGQKEFRDVYYTKNNRLLEKFIFNKEIVDKNIDLMNSISEYLNIESVGMFIPNSIAIYEDELPFYALTDSQKDALDYIKERFKNKYYSPYNILLKNKEKDIYFKTDHHWTQFGAKLMYEDYYNKKISSKYEKVSSDFLGTYYSKVLLDKIKPEGLYAYNDFQNYRIKYDGKSSNTLYEETRLNGKNKYQYFLNGDPAVALIEGEGQGEVLIFKDSFAHNYIPFLTKEYSKIHVIDPRYSNFNIVDYVDDNKNISKIYYIYSLSSLNSSDIFLKYKNILNK